MDIYCFLYLLTLVSIPLVIFRVNNKSNFLTFILFVFNSIFLVTLFMLDQSFPFTKSGDDIDYYKSSLKVFSRLNEWFDFRQFNQFEQGGYPLLLTWINQVVGKSLYLKKVFNLQLFILTSIIWYKIGNVISGRIAGVVFFVGIILGTPLWYYWIFLLKDMAIIFLQSFFFMCVIKMIYGENSRLNYIVMAIVTLLIIPFRIYFVFVNIVSFLFATVVCCKGRANLLLNIFLLSIMICILIVINSNKSFLNYFGVSGHDRDMAVSSIENKINTYVDHGNKKSNLFLFTTYFLGETSGFSPKSWQVFNSFWLRGITVIPWVLLGVPLFCYGIYDIAFGGSRFKPQFPHSNSDEHIRGLYFVIFVIVLYGIITWISKDTTRWRMPSYPAMLGIAGWGWLQMTPVPKFIALTLWITLLSLGFFLLHSLIK